MTSFPTPGSEAAYARAERAADERVYVPQVVLDLDAVLDGSWMAGAACRDRDPEMFHSPSPGDTRPAQSTCGGCRFNQPCRVFRYATGSTGMWAGTYYTDSGSGVHYSRQKCALQRCTGTARRGSVYCSFACQHRAIAGTRAGYDLHMRVSREARKAGQEPTTEMRVCGPCRDAKAADVVHRRSPAHAA